MTRFLGVHGIGNHRPGLEPDAAAENLAQRWEKALRRGLPEEAVIDMRVAYYAHHLARGIAQGPESLDAQEQQLLLDWARHLGAPEDVAQGRLTAPARRAADWIARKFGLDSGLVRIMVSVFCREVRTYFEDTARRSAARDEVANRIAEHRPNVVIAHSLGSVLAYEALWSRQESTVDMLITLGSPLGLPDVIFEKLEPLPDKGKGRRPPNVERWINIADPGDIVAIPRGLASRFDGIAADLETSINVFDFHKVSNYLACSTTSAAVAGFSQTDT
ncbi:hypothetical protein [Allokutzneria albata]|uniref:Serine peptidase n=1 Tax=Allokutzneria albata TaxID=211114 RepID=A0A1G9VPB2_ALLAB|nr:hypothetical protein [Allokutzneria albata]SDM74038.1 hypothetical protein SAMN04489726_3156 [Allokutzneria albata]